MWTGGIRARVIVVHFAGGVRVVGKARRMQALLFSLVDRISRRPAFSL